MAKSAAMRRLESILSNEEYGPKLVRLNRADETYILDLIDRNQGRLARKEILRLDEQRLARTRARRASKRAPVINIETLRQRAYAKMRASFNNSHPHRVKRNELYATQDELQYILDATPDEIRERAKEPERTYQNIEYPDQEIEINPFWYK